MRVVRPEELSDPPRGPRVGGRAGLRRSLTLKPGLVRGGAYGLGLTSRMRGPWRAECYKHTGCLEKVEHCCWRQDPGSRLGSPRQRGRAPRCNPSLPRPSPAPHPHPFLPGRVSDTSLALLLAESLPRTLRGDNRAPSAPAVYHLLHSGLHALPRPSRKCLLSTHTGPGAGSPTGPFPAAEAPSRTCAWGCWAHRELTGEPRKGLWRHRAPEPRCWGLGHRRVA